ncbi:hypothetical protein B0H14DRAFT_3722570 [Mycena olivaceomarginata]|nr:hypothetical protein B0H14DRAFT_3722570 [Mycena olivaceomarginata]
MSLCLAQSIPVSPMIMHWNPSGRTPDFIRTLYRNVLDRDPESQEVVDLHTRSAYNSGLCTTVGGFFNSIEYRAKSIPTEETVKKLYRSILNREPEGEGADYHARQIARGRTSWIVTPETQAVVDSHCAVADERGLHTAIAGFFTSREYRAKGLSTAETVKKLYSSILGREPDTGGAEYHAQRLDSGRSLEDTVRTFVDSPEYHARAQKGLIPGPTATQSGFDLTFDVGVYVQATNSEFGT